jgi:hypothetical protein
LIADLKLRGALSTFSGRRRQRLSKTSRKSARQSAPREVRALKNSRYAMMAPKSRAAFIDLSAGNNPVLSGRQPIADSRQPKTGIR